MKLYKFSGALAILTSIYKGTFIPIVSLKPVANQTKNNERLINSILVPIPSNQVVLKPEFYFCDVYLIRFLNRSNNLILKIISSSIYNQNGVYGNINKKVGFLLFEIPNVGIECSHYSRINFAQVDEISHPSETLAYNQFYSEVTILKFIEKIESVYLIDLLEMLRSNAHISSLGVCSQYNSIGENTSNIYSTCHVPVLIGPKSILPIYGKVIQVIIDLRNAITNKYNLVFDYKKAYNNILRNIGNIYTYDATINLKYPQNSDVIIKTLAI